MKNFVILICLLSSSLFSATTIVSDTLVIHDDECYQATTYSWGSPNSTRNAPSEAECPFDLPTVFAGYEIYNYEYTRYDEPNQRCYYTLSVWGTEVVDMSVCEPEPCVGDIIENIPTDGFIEVGIGIPFDVATTWVSDFLYAHPNVTATETKSSDTCGNAVYVNAKYDDICSIGETLQPDGTTYGEVGLTHYSCSPDPNYECENGYSKDDAGYCQPDIDCPSPMIYKYIVVNWGLDTKGCFPDKNITESACNSSGNVYAKYFDEDPSDPLSTFASVFGDGCMSVSYANEKIDDALWHTFVSGLLPTMGVSTSLLAQDLSRLFTSGKNLWNNIGSAFKNSPVDDVKLLTYKPKVTEMQMADDGVFYEVEPFPMAVDDIVSTENQTAYNQFLKENGYITKTDDIPSATENIEFPSVIDDMGDLFYRGSDSIDFTNNMLGTANIIKNGKVPKLSLLDDLIINKQVETTTSINSKLVGTQIKNYPTFIAKTSQKTLSDRVESTYKGYIKFPDNTKTELAISRVKYLDDGRVIDDVTTNYDVVTSSGTKTFTSNYQSFTDSSGAVTNVINSPSSITTNTTSGSTTTTNQSTNTVTTNTTQSAVDLTPFVEKLNSIDDKLRAIINTEIPSQIAEATISLDHFNASVDLFDVDFNTYKDFLDGMIDNANELTTLFDDTKAILEDKPVVNEINGQCGFDMNYHGTDIHVDLCEMIFPYRPILALIFTLLGTFAVLGFTVKYLVSRGD